MPIQSGPRSASGPWDGAGSYPEAERIDFGSLLIPIRPVEFKVIVANDDAVAVTATHGDSTLWLQAFAAPETRGIWDEVRAELAAEIARSGGRSTEAQGPFGTELQAQIRPEVKPQERPEPTRIIGVDGPRWFLRGHMNGPAATDPELARPFEEVFADIVVIRGQHSVPPRELLVIRLPDELITALEEEAVPRWMRRRNGP